MIVYLAQKFGICKSLVPLTYARVTPNSRVRKALLATVLTACAGSSGEVAQSGPTSAGDELQHFDHDLEVGSDGADVRALHAYLSRFGYFPNAQLARQYPAWRPALDDRPKADDIFDDRTAAALRALQRNYGISVTGILDGDTRDAINRPRCGVVDGIPRSDGSDKFALWGTNWPTPAPTLTWKIGSVPNSIEGCGNATCRFNALRNAVVTAFDNWEAQTDIEFVESIGTTNIGIDAGSLGSGLLGQAQFPPAGAVMLNNNLQWTASLLRHVLTHEFGHAIGLAHSSVQYPDPPTRPMMWPSSNGSNGFADSILSDDQASVSALYDTWLQVDACTADVAAGPAVSAWAVACNDSSVWKFSSSWVQDTSGVVASRIAVDAQGFPLVVRQSDGAVLRKSSSSATTGTWTSVTTSGANCAKDVAVGFDGSVWSIGCTSTAGGFNIRKLVNGAWVTVSGGGVRIAVDDVGRPWVINSSNQIFRRSSSSTSSGSFSAVPGAAKDIAINRRMPPWVIGTNNAGNLNSSVFVWNEQIERDEGATEARAEWIRVAARGTSISVSPEGTVWTSTSGGLLFRQCNLNDRASGCVVP